MKERKVYRRRGIRLKERSMPPHGLMATGNGATCSTMLYISAWATVVRMLPITLLSIDGDAQCAYGDNNDGTRYRVNFELPDQWYKVDGEQTAIYT
jgi:hypothetical protein